MSFSCRALLTLRPCLRHATANQNCHVQASCRSSAIVLHHVSIMRAQQLAVLDKCFRAKASVKQDYVPVGEPLEVRSPITLTEWVPAP